MVAFTYKAPGDWNTDGQVVWNEVGHPDGADDSASGIAGAVTAAAGIVCGAVSVAAGGDLNTGTNAATIASLTLAGTGAATIGTGGVTLAGVLNNTGSGLLTINGNVTGSSSFSPGNCNIAAGVSYSFGVGGLISQAAGTTLTLGDGASINGLTSNCTLAGTTTTGAGCTIGFNTPSNRTITVSGSLTMVGTSGSRCTFTNLGAATSGAITTSTTAGTIDLQYTDVSKFYIYPREHTDVRLRLNNVTISGTGSFAALYTGTHRVDLDRLWLYGNLRGVDLCYGNGGAARISNIVFGYNLAGAVSANTTADIAMHYYPGVITIRNAVFGTVVWANTGVNYAPYPGRIEVENLGHVASDMVAGGSALAAAVVDAGVYKTISRVHSVERSTANPPAGETYHARVYELNAQLAETPYPGFDLYVPIASGDDISVAMQASRSGDTSDIADCWIDPEGAWFDGTTAVAWALTDAATYYALPSCTASGALGTGAVGQVRINVRVKEFTAAQYVDFGAAVVTVTHADASVDKYAVDFSMGRDGEPMPILSKDLPAVADVESGVTYDWGSLTGTLAAGASAGAFETGAWR